jgi:predicted solute-binding protein
MVAPRFAAKTPTSYVGLLLLGIVVAAILSAVAYARMDHTLTAANPAVIKYQAPAMGTQAETGRPQ